MLAELAADIDLEDVGGMDVGEKNAVDDDMDGWIDERDSLTEEEERRELRESVLPVMLVLAKVSKHVTYLAPLHLQPLPTTL